MPLFYLRQLTGRKRTEPANKHLACYLALVAGASNAGGFLAVRQYTSHMSGIVSAAADAVAVGEIPIVFGGLASVISFLSGAFLTTLLIRWARTRNLESEYALPLVAEAALLVLFGFTGHVFSGGRILGNVMLLCFTMGLQNAIITKLSNAVIRTTHLTGMFTDIGIILGRLVSRTPTEAQDGIEAEFVKLRLLSSLIALFFIGGIIGALGFKHVGFLFTIPLAAGLVVLSAIPIVDDMRRLVNATDGLSDAS
jgi:uncharacterized membrane protein YoaK (UPF0700 family)